VAEVDAHGTGAGRYEYSIRQAADAFGLARETITRRLTDANVAPCGKRKGFPVYRVRDIYAALLTGESFGDGAERDPNRMGPQDRNAWFQSEAKRLDVETRARQLIPAAEHEADLAEMAKDLAQFLETLPDQLERDTALTPEQVTRMHDLIASQRQALYNKMVSDDAVRAGE